MNWSWILIFVVVLIVLFLIKKVTKLVFKIAVLAVAFLIALYVYNNYFVAEEALPEPQTNISVEGNVSQPILSPPENVSEQASEPVNSSSND
ncbi:hypothetical protein HY643_01595 [Candidatus Woesearchaeota archaeon]|nr:hypothetical protein [Candidatus Woesearchaeota archaeon]